MDLDYNFAAGSGAPSPQTSPRLQHSHQLQLGARVLSSQLHPPSDSPGRSGDAGTTPPSETPGFCPDQGGRAVGNPPCRTSSVFSGTSSWACRLARALPGGRSARAALPGAPCVRLGSPRAVRPLRAHSPGSPGPRPRPPGARRWHLSPRPQRGAISRRALGPPSCSPPCFGAGRPPS